MKRDLRKSSLLSYVPEIMIISGMIILAVILAEKNYELLHFIIYGYRFVIGIVLYIFAKNTLRLTKNHYFYIVSLIVMSVGIFDILHSIFVPGMNVINANDTYQLSFAYYFIGRIIECVGLFVIPFFIGRKVKPLFWELSFIFGFSLIIFMVYFHSEYFYSTVLYEGVLAIILKTAYSLLLLGSMWLHYKRKKYFNINVLIMIMIPLFLLNIANVLNMIIPEGMHMMHIVSSIIGSIAYYLIFKTLIHNTLRNPVEILFIDLSKKEQILLENQNKLELRVEERTTEIHNINKQLEMEIDEKEKVFENLNRTRTLLRSALEQNPSGIIVIEVKDLIIRIFNDTFIEILKLSKDDVYEGMSFNDLKIGWEYISPRHECLDQESSPIIRSFNGEIIRNLEYHILFPNQEEKWLIVASSPVRDETGNIYAALLVITDITPIKNTYSQLEKNESLYRTLINTSPDAITLTDINGKLTFLSPQIKEIFGYPDVSYALGKSPIHFVEDSDKHKASKNIKELLKGRSIRPEVYKLKRMDGSFFYGEITTAIVRDASGKPDALLSIIRDITNRINAEQVMERLMNELESKNQELESIIYVTSHDLRSPLVNIQGFGNEIQLDLKFLHQKLEHTELLSEQDSQITHIIYDVIPESLSFISASVDKMDLLLKALLKISRLGRIKVSFDQIDMNDLIDQVIKNFRHRIQKDNVIIDVDELPPCLGSYEYINQVFSNLVDNAIKYLLPKRQGHIRIFAKRKDEYVVYCVEDNGVGIEPQYLSKIFDIFNRLNPRDDISGEGLGLAMIRRIVAKHKGQVWVESEPGIGSRFFIKLVGKI